MLSYYSYHGVSKRFSEKVYDALLQNNFPRNTQFEEDNRPSKEVDPTLNQQELYLARKDEVPPHMKAVIELIKRILIGLRTEKKDFDCLTELQRSVVQTYMRYILTAECIVKIFNRDPALEEYKFGDDDFLDLSKRKDETLKKVMSVALKVIYKEYLFENKINQSLNPRKYVKRKEINEMIFRKYFKRDPLIVTRGKIELAEHYLLFFIKEGVTEEWFESIIGIRHQNADKKKQHNLDFLKKVLDTLRSDKLMDVYRRKITSMAKKIFVMDRKFVLEGHDRFDPETAEEWYKRIQQRLDLRNKKPKTALSILQFSHAINVALGSLRRFVDKYELSQDLEPKYFDKVEFCPRENNEALAEQDEQCEDSDNSASD